MGIDLSGLISGAFEAALDDGLWPSWSRTALNRLGGSGGACFIINADHGSLDRAINLVSNDKAIDQYYSDYYRIDPQFRSVCSFEGSGTYSDYGSSAIRSQDDIAYVEWQTGIAQAAHTLTAVMSFDTSPSKLALCVHRPGKDGPVPVSHRDALDAALPQLRRAANLAFSHGAMLQEAFWNGIIVGRNDRPAFLLDERGRAIRHTDAAERLLGRRDGLDIKDGFLRAWRPADDAALDAAIGGAIDPIDPQSAAVRVGRPSGKVPIILVCYPLTRTSRHFAPLSAAALVVAADPAAPRPATQALYRQAFGLTKREADLACALMMGHSVESAAMLLSLSIATARTHMRHLFEKTQTTRQASLIELLARLSG